MCAYLRVTITTTSMASSKSRSEYTRIIENLFFSSFCLIGNNSKNTIEYFEDSIVDSIN